MIGASTFEFSSIVISLAIVEAIMSCLMILFWFSKTQAAGLKEMAIATAAGGIGALLTALAYSPPNFNLLYYGNLFFIISVLFAARSMRKLQAFKTLYALEATAFIGAVSLNYYLVVIEKNVANMVLTSTTVYVLVCAFTAKNLLTEKRPDLIQGCKILGFMFLGFAAFQLLKLLLRPLIEAVPSLAAQISMMDYIDAFVGMCVAISWSFGLIWASYSQSEIQLLGAKKIAEQQARTDILTGLNNRRAFFEHANAIDSYARRHNQSYVVAMIDLDRFKEINDTWGHEVGDLTLKEIAELISTVLRKDDIVGRIGGEEFAVIMPKTVTRDGIQLTELIRQRVEEHIIRTSNNSIRVTLSAGLSSLRDRNVTLREIVANADLALYEAKSNGRNQVNLKEA